MNSIPFISTEYSDKIVQMEKRNDRRLIDSALIFIAGASYGFIVPVVKLGTAAGISPAGYIPMQYLIAMIVCAIVVFAKRIPLGRPRGLLPLVILGFCTGSTSICYYNAVTLLPSSAALTLLFQYIWVSVLIEWIHRRQAPSVSTVIAIVIVLVGTVFATGLFDEGGMELDPLGVVFGLGSAVFYALYLYLSGTLATDRPFMLRTLMLAVGGFIVSSIANPLVFVKAMPNLDTWPYSAGLACLGILIPTTLINYASPRLSAGMVSIMASSELPMGIFAAWLIVADTPSPLVLFGALLVLAGIVVKQIPTLMNETRLR